MRALLIILLIAVLCWLTLILFTLIVLSPDKVTVPTVIVFGVFLATATSLRAILCADMHKDEDPYR